MLPVIGRRPPYPRLRSSFSLCEGHAGLAVEIEHPLLHLANAMGVLQHVLGVGPVGDLRAAVEVGQHYLAGVEEQPADGDGPVDGDQVEDAVPRHPARSPDRQAGVPDAGEVADRALDDCARDAQHPVAPGHAVPEAGAAARAGVHVPHHGDDGPGGRFQGVVVLVPRDRGRVGIVGRDLRSDDGAYRPAELGQHGDDLGPGVVQGDAAPGVELVAALAASHARHHGVEQRRGVELPERVEGLCGYGSHRVLRMKSGLVWRLYSSGGASGPRRRPGLRRSTEPGWGAP